MSAHDSPVPSPFAGLGRGLDRAVTRGMNTVTGGAIAPYQSAIVRIGFSLTWLLFLLREFPHRVELYGPDAPWSWDLAKQLVAGNHAFTVLLWTDSRGWFEIVYAFAIVASVMLLLGWRTRTASVLFMIGVLSLQNRSIFEGDGGDNVIHLMAIYLVFTRCGTVWSLDRRLAVRRAAKAAKAADVGKATEAGADPVGIALWTVFGVALLAASLAGKLSTGWALLFWAFWLIQAVWWAVLRVAPGEPRTVLDIIADIVHNGAMLVIVVEVCLIYSTAGWYKIQGGAWQDGTALYYPLHLDDFSPWPALSHTLAGNDLAVMLITYGTVIVQVAFPFTLFNRRVKNVLLVAMMLEHASIAVVLGLPFFSLAMIAADAVFLPTGFLVWAADRLLRRLRPGGGRPAAVVHEQRAAGSEQGVRPAGPADPAVGPPPTGAVT
ncbi:HTTM domain-containing protein [Actinacidiphila alni]|uniref:HTTM domain-containing protein n=1 Tax=Actinacidiphila alni TaxID=380248 RepID=UPI0033CA6261